MVFIFVLGLTTTTQIVVAAQQGFRNRHFDEDEEREDDRKNMEEDSSVKSLHPKVILRHLDLKPAHNGTLVAKVVMVLSWTKVYVMTGGRGAKFNMSGKLAREIEVGDQNMN